MNNQSSALTINQEKQLRALKRNPPPKIDLHDIGDLVAYKQLATLVRQYRRAQRLTSPEATKLRKEFSDEIDALLEALEVK